MSKNKKLTRRDFARTSVATGAAAVAFPGALLGKTPAGKAGARGALAARRRRAALPRDVAEVGYGGMSIDGRDALLEHTLSRAGQAPAYPGGWQEGTTIPGEYYVEEKQYLNDEQFLKEHFWWMVDHASRIPNPGDYFLWQYGRGDSVIILRDQAGAVKGYHNMCRHRGSRLCGHDELLPTEAGPGSVRPEEKFSVIQLGTEGNTPVFRCPYHAWTYDLSGKLVSFPRGPGGMPPTGFDPTQHGLHPVALEVLEGFIYVSLAEEPPDFDAWTANLRPAFREARTAELKVAARRSVPTKANWKLVLENYRECYHCGPGHSNSYVVAHWDSDYRMTAGQRAAIEREIERHGHPWYEPGTEAARYQQRGPRDRLIAPPSSGGGMGMGTRGRHWRPGWVTASLDGKPVAPLLPGVTEHSHGRARATGGSSGFSTSNISLGYPDHIRTACFVPRGVMFTDAVAHWLVHPDAEEGKDYDVEHLIGLWHNTLREDRWLAENNHYGIQSGRYAYKGGQPYMAWEGGPAGLVKWYMGEVVGWASEERRQTDAV